MEFLWVKWLGPVDGYAFGKKLAKLPKVTFLADSDEFSFGFLDPSLVLRGCHLIPAFANGKKVGFPATPKTTETQSPGFMDLWQNYYVGM
jgi:hypothetical protein